MPGRLLLLSAASLALTVAGNCRADPVFLGPTPYLSAGDSPFLELPFDSFFLESFEDGALDTPGVTASPGWTVLAPGPATDSVDGDDLAIDGSGAGGRSFYSGNAQSSLTFTFDATVLGSLPTFAGIVWTDVGNVTSGTIGIGGVSLQAFDAIGNALGLLGPVTLGDGNAAGGTAEDRFLGVTHSGGISRITIAMDNSVDWEVDHLQYGQANLFVIPEPSSLLLAGLGLVAPLLGLRSRRPARP